jgi:hypothetical protein
VTNTQQFNAVTYKATTRDQWDAAAQAWDAWGPTLEAWLGEATELMLDLGQLATGSRVLDVAAGAGGQSIAAARRVGSDGRVLTAELADTGFRDIEAPLRLASAAECLRFERESFGALHQMLSGLPEAEREAAWAEVGEALTAFQGPGGFAGPCRLLVAAGTR